MATANRVLVNPTMEKLRVSLTRQAATGMMREGRGLGLSDGVEDGAMVLAEPSHQYFLDNSTRIVHGSTDSPSVHHEYGGTKRRGATSCSNW
jgi:hypothetical protein